MGTLENRAATLAKLEADEVAVSGRGPRASRWSTWVKLHRNWLPHEPVLPLTTHSIAAVMSQLKEGDYSASPDYMSTAKARRLKLYEWTSMLARQHTVCVRSATRGTGPRKQCKEVDMATFVSGAIKLADDMRVPVGLPRSAVICYFFM